MRKENLKVSAAESPYSYLKGVHYVRNVKWDFFPLPLAERTQFGGSVVPPPLRSFLRPSAPPSVPLPPSPPLPGCRINVRIMKTEYRPPGALTENGALKRLWGNENGGFVQLQTLRGREVVSSVSAESLLRKCVHFIPLIQNLKCI